MEAWIFGNETAVERPSNRPLRYLLLASIGVMMVGCGSGGPGQDKITIGTGQSSQIQSTDPTSVDFPIFYVKRPVPVLTQNMQPPTALDLTDFQPGADLYMRTSASPSAQETNLTGQLTQQLGDVRDVDVSWDGTKVVFAMRFPYDPNVNNVDNQNASWDIYEYDIATGTVRGLLVDPIRKSRTDPRFDDRFPHYLPDGRIVFASNRQRTSQAILLDENKPQYQAQDENNNEAAFVLHVMNGDGSDVHQISFNQSHDLDSAVLPNGQLVFSRWNGARNPDAISLYSMDPDGTQLRLLYGAQPCTHLITNGNTNCTSNTTTPIQFLSPRPVQNGQLMSLVRPFTGTDDGGDLVYIDTNNYVENTQPTLPNVGILNGPAQTRVSPIQINTEPDVGSLGGRYRSVYPLPDNSNRLLVSWSQCRVIENGKTEPCNSQRLDPNLNPPLQLAPPLYGIYIYNLNDNTQLPIVVPQEGFIYDDVVAASPHAAPPVILDRAPGVDYPTTLASQSVGILDIKSVYDFDGTDRAPGGIDGVRDPSATTVAQRPARFIRLEKAVSLPNRDVRNIRGTSFSPAGRFMREILGYAPIAPDGSVRVRVPANVAFQFSIVDSNGRRITTPDAQGFFSPIHRDWLQVRPGEVLTCNGCHTPQQANSANQQSHGRDNLFTAANEGAPASGLFPNTDPALWGNPGDTMAEVRAKRMEACKLIVGGNDSDSACAPSVDVIFDDFWTDPSATKAASFDYCYSAGLTDVASDVTDSTMKHLCATKLDTPAPVASTCETSWTSNCRVVINYIAHIQPIWDKSRPFGATGDNVCTSCHSPTNAMGQAQVPAGQLDLNSTTSDDEPDHLTSYQKLLFTHRAQELNATMTALQDVCLQRDPVTDVCTQFQTVGPPMLALNARGSRFFTAMNDATHTGMMTDAEKRLISEWLDIGAQYYNDPFLAPEN